MNTHPPLIRFRDVVKMFGGKVTKEEIESWEDCGLLHPFQKKPRSHKWFRYEEAQRIKNGEITTT